MLYYAIKSAVLFIFLNSKYKKSSYSNVTSNSYLSVKQDKGKYGEYLIYESLKHFEDTGGKFLFNIHIPKSKDSVTEIDLILICRKGLFVIESKNYSGWIFGNEAHQYWTQTLPKGRGQSHKERFYNPILQNASHVRHLKNLVGQNAPARSIIVFSDRCTLKSITLKSSDVRVVNRYGLASVVAEIFSQSETDFYTEQEINDVYNKLYPYTQLEHGLKERHIESIIKNQPTS